MLRYDRYVIEKKQALELLNLIERQAQENIKLLVKLADLKKRVDELEKDLRNAQHNHRLYVTYAEQDFRGAV